jgi:hypothetical protein
VFTADPFAVLPETVPLYYATLCDFYSLTKCIILKHPIDVNAGGGCHATSFYAMLAKENTDIALLLLSYSVNINALNNDSLSLLHKALRSRHCDIVEFLPCKCQQAEPTIWPDTITLSTMQGGV